jgi:hypothetical protein
MHAYYLTIVQSITTIKKSMYGPNIKKIKLSENNIRKNIFTSLTPREKGPRILKCCMLTKKSNVHPTRGGAR